MGQLKMIFDAEATPVPLLNMPHGFSLHAVLPRNAANTWHFGKPQLALAGTGLRELSG